MCVRARSTNGTAIRLTNNSYLCGRLAGVPSGLGATQRDKINWRHTLPFLLYFLTHLLTLAGASYSYNFARFRQTRATDDTERQALFLNHHHHRRRRRAHSTSASRSISIKFNDPKGGRTNQRTLVVFFAGVFVFD